MEISTEEGKFLVRLARSAVEVFLKDGTAIKPPRNTPKPLRERTGVFVTINKLTGDGRDLRGCIGISNPIKPLVEATIDSAINSSTKDPRFPSLREDELSSVTFEVSILTPPELIEVTSPQEYPENIVVGRDGLIIEKGIFTGLLLPQVPVEYDWEAEEYLLHLCLKAGLSPDAWLLKDVNIYRFSAIIFEEKEPGGEVVRRN